MKNCCLIVIDVQKGLDDPIHGKRSTPCFEHNLSKVLQYFRSKQVEVIHVIHDSVENNSLLRPGLPGNEIKKEAEPIRGEVIFRKSTAGAFHGTNLQEYIKEKNVEDLYVAGLTTDHCVSTTVRVASDLGYNLFVLSDATAAHEKKAWDGCIYDAEQVHTLSLVALEGEFAKILSTKELVTGKS